MSPEILESTNGYSSRAADVWSLGVIIFTMLSGRYPFHEPDATALFAKIKVGHYIIPEHISSSGQCLIHSILRKVPGERLTTEELCEHPWFNHDFESNFSGFYNGRFDGKRIDQLVPDLSFSNENVIFQPNSV